MHLIGTGSSFDMARANHDARIPRAEAGPTRILVTRHMMRVRSVLMEHNDDTKPGGAFCEDPNQEPLPPQIGGTHTKPHLYLVLLLCLDTNDGYSDRVVS